MGLDEVSTWRRDQGCKPLDELRWYECHTWGAIRPQALPSSSVSTADGDDAVQGRFTPRTEGAARTRHPKRIPSRPSTPTLLLSSE